MMVLEVLLNLGGGMIFFYVILRFRHSLNLDLDDDHDVRLVVGFELQVALDDSLKRLR